MNSLSLTPSLQRGLREAGIALGAAFVIAASPFVPASRPWLKALVFVSIAVGVFAYRARSLAQQGEAPVEADSGEVGLRISPLLVLSIVGIAILFQPTFYWMYRQWTLSVWLNTHGIFVPPLVAYLAYIMWRQDKTTEPASSAWGFAFVIPALALFVLDFALRTRFLSAIAFVVLLPGLSLLFLGTERTRSMRVPLIIALFMVPLPYLVTSVLFLREITTEGVVALLRLGGVAVYSEGTVIQLAWGPFRVSEACSGLSTFYSAIAIAVVFTGLSSSPGRRAALMLSAIPLAITANIVRVIVLVFLCKWFGNELLATPIHEGSGAATFAVVFVILHRIANPQDIRGALR